MMPPDERNQMPGYHGKKSSGGMKKRPMRKGGKK
tara:strand:- start:2706 stop:2807 length:102 start_codon:yes stop_codon:yes gene_type:complete